MTSKKALCIAGKNRVAVQALSLLDKLGLFDLLVCPVESDAGCDNWQPSLLKEASSRNKEIVTLEQAYKINGLTFLSLEFDKIIKVDRFDNATLLNVHFSLLPAYKGCFTSVWPIYYGEKESGVTLHSIDWGIDTGPVIDQEHIILDEAMTARELYEAYQDSAIIMLERNVKPILNGDLLGKHQLSKNSTYFSRSSLSSLCREIDFAATADQVSRQVRALFFPEFQTATCHGVPIANCEILGERSNRKPGTILSETDSSMALATIDFDIKLTKFQPGSLDQG